MARVTVVKSPFNDALDRPDPMSLDESYPDGHAVNEFPDESFWGKDPALKYEQSLEDESPYLN